MGQGEEVKTRADDPEVEVQEKGEIFFFYRPKVDKEAARGPDDVQRMYIVLRPESGERAVEGKQAPDSGKEGRKRGGARSEEGHEGGHGEEEVNIEEQTLLRLLVMGKKSLPDPAKRGRPYWGYVELVTTKLEDVKDALKEVMKIVWGVIAICFKVNSRPNTLGQFWVWIKKGLPGAEKVYCLGLAAICWAAWNRACFDKKIIKRSCEIICDACSLMNYWASLYPGRMQEIIRAGADSMLKPALQVMSRQGRVIMLQPSHAGDDSTPEDVAEPNEEACETVIGVLMSCK